MRQYELPRRVLQKAQKQGRSLLGYLFLELRAAVIDDRVDNLRTTYGLENVSVNRYKCS